MGIHSRRRKHSCVRNAAPLQAWQMRPHFACVATPWHHRLQVSEREVTMPHVVSEAEVEFSAVRAQGPGGQNVHKVSSAVHLRFDIRASSLPPDVKNRLLALSDQRISKDGIIVIKAQASRSHEKNKAAALERLQALVAEASHMPRVRRPTKPTFGSRQRRLVSKALRSGVKASRGKVRD